MTGARWLLTLCVALVCSACADPYASSGPMPPSRSASKPAPMEADARSVGRQDQVPAAHREREERAMGERPLLDLLPLRVGTVRISVGGLSEDGTKAELEVDANGASKPRARQIYRRALRSFGDSGTAYEVRIVDHR